MENYNLWLNAKHTFRYIIVRVNKRCVIINVSKIGCPYGFTFSGFTSRGVGRATFFVKKNPKRVGKPFGVPTVLDG
mgnify:CR=1 FL=1